jgi:hypothetical protein
VERKNLHPRIKQFYANFLRKPDERRNDWPNDPERSWHDDSPAALADNKTAGGRLRSARLEAVARELRKIGYVVMVNASKSGMVVITRDDEP